MSDGDAVLVSKNGALRDPVTGQFVKGGVVSTAIASPSQARAMVERKMEIKRERARLGANAALKGLRRREWNSETKRYEDVGAAWEDPSDLDFIEAITEAQAAQALIVGDPSSTKAAEFVLRHTGYDEPRGKDADADGGVTFDDAQRELIRDLAAIARRVSAEIGAIDAEVTPTEDG